MLYALISDGVIEKIIPRPQWIGDDGEPVSDEFLKTRNLLPVIYSPPTYEADLQRITINPKTEWLIGLDDVRATYTVENIPIEDLREMKLQAVTDKRWEVMTGGMTLPNGVQVGTTIDDQNRITSVVANAALAGLTDADEVDFKSNSGWVRITIAEVKAIAGAIGQFVQACYSAERAHHEAIAALETPEEIAAYDIEVGWPGTL